MLIAVVSMLLAAVVGFASHRASLCTVRAVGEVMSARSGYLLQSFGKATGVPVVAFAGIVLDEETEAPEIGADISAMHASCAETALESASPIIRV